MGVEVAGNVADLAIQVGVATAAGAAAAGQVNADLVAEETRQAVTTTRTCSWPTPKCVCSELVMDGRRPCLYTTERHSSARRISSWADSAKSVSGTWRHTLARDEPVNLSGSGSETHQHWWSIGATCCHSLLLDPNAMIAIDLRKRLFLLVTGRGE